MAVPSKAAGRQLAARGVGPAAIRVLPPEAEGASPADPDAATRPFWQLCKEATDLRRAPAAVPAGLATLVRDAPAAAAETLSPVAAHWPATDVSGAAPTETR